MGAGCGPSRVGRIAPPHGHDYPLTGVDSARFVRAMPVSSLFLGLARHLHKRRGMSQAARSVAIRVMRATEATARGPLLRTRLRGFSFLFQLVFDPTKGDSLMKRFLSSCARLPRVVFSVGVAALLGSLAAPAMNRKRTSLLGSFLVLLIATASARAAIVPVPTGLQPGDKYYLAFVTSGRISGTSADIADYNAFAQSQANTVQSLSGFTWKAAVSTTSVSALTNLNIGNFPVYRIDGVQIATGATDLWDGSLMAAINVNQNGTVYELGTWTGSQSNGNAFAPYQLGSSEAVAGGSNQTGGLWMAAVAYNSLENLPVYAFSNQLIVPVPEPASTSIAACGVALGGLAVARRRRAAKSA